MSCLKYFEKILIVFVHESTNTVAHMLNQVTYFMSGFRNWYDIAPDFITCNLELDKL